MPFRDLPPRSRSRLRLVLASAYTFMAYTGTVAIIWTPNTIQNTLGVSLTYLWAAAALLGGVLGFLGILVDRYRLEWVAAWLCFTGVGIYAVTVWSLVLGTITRQAQAGALTVLALLFWYRGTELAAHASKLRQQHRQLAALEG